MTLDEFLDNHPEVLSAHMGDQLVAVAWFLLTHEQKPRFTFNEIMGRMKAVGINAAEVPLIGLKYCDPKNQKLMNLIEDNTHYYRLIRSVKNELDTKFADCLTPETTTAVSNTLAELPNKYPFLGTCPYWEETIICYRNKALRAAVIMAWNLVYNQLCEYILADPIRMAAFNQCCPRPVSIRDDFTEYREADILTWARNASVIIPNIHTILAEKLKRRNIFAHASGITPIAHDVDAFILDLIQHVLPRIS
jgi:hypothetical protein